MPLTSTPTYYSFTHQSLFHSLLNAITRPASIQSRISNVERQFSLATGEITYYLQTLFDRLQGMPTSYISDMRMILGQRYVPD